MPATYTWNNSARNLSTTTAWTPTRSSPLSTDILVISPDAVNHTPNTGSATCATCAISGSGIDGGTIVGATTHTAGDLAGTFSNLTVYSDTDLSSAGFSAGARLSLITHNSIVPDIGTGSGGANGVDLTSVTTIVSDGSLTAIGVNGAVDGVQLTNKTITIAGNFSAVATNGYISTNNNIDMTGTTVTTTGSLKYYTLLNVDGAPSMVGFGNGVGGGGRIGLGL